MILRIYLSNGTIISKFDFCGLMIIGSKTVFVSGQGRFLISRNKESSSSPLVQSKPYPLLPKIKENIRK